MLRSFTAAPSHPSAPWLRAMLLLACTAFLMIKPAGAIAQAVSVSIAFEPASIQTGGTSRLTITLGNTGAAAVLASTLTDTLPRSEEHTSELQSP